MTTGLINSWPSGADITQRKESEEILRQSQKLESLGILSGGIAHDFNNLLTTILGNTNLGAMHLPPESPAMPYLHHIEQATLRAADLTRQLLAYAGKGRFQVTEVDLNRLVVEMTQLLTVTLSRKAVIRYDLSPSLPFISADPSQMQQLVMNLVTNASEAIGDEVSGLITIRTGVQLVDEATQVGLLPALPLAAGEYVTLEVSDTGCGMAPEVRERIFDPFYTTKFTGRGLGLSAMLGILRSHHGSLKVYSEPSRGTVFKLFLPALLLGVEDRPPRLAAREWQSHGILLLVDDEPSARAVARELAESMGFQVLEAADGLEAVALFELRHAEITVVLMDLTMPHMDGRQAFLRMHQSGSANSGGADQRLQRAGRPHGLPRQGVGWIPPETLPEQPVPVGPPAGRGRLEVLRVCSHQQHPQHFLGHLQPHDGGHVGDGAHGAALPAGAAVGLDVQGIGRALVVGGLQGIDASDALGDAHFPQLFADPGGQGAAACVAEVAHEELAAVQASPCSHGRDDGDARFVGGTHEGHLAGHGIDGVDHHIRPRCQQVRQGLRVNEGHAGIHIAVRVDVPHAGRGHLGLGLAEGGAQGEELAVEVAGAHHIVIHEAQVAHARPGQGFHGKRPHPPQAEHRHPGGP